MLGANGALLERYMDVLAARQRVTASNIANADTPGYRARDIDFRAEMQNFLFFQPAGGSRSSGSQPSGPPGFPAVLVRETWGQGVKNDGNNVSLDHEMQALAENTLRFTLASVLLAHHLRGIQSGIREGK